MEDKYYEALAKARIERADELLNEADRLLGDGSYKSANNRAYYAIEKAINALLIDHHIETRTHNGAMKMFNVEYVRPDDAYFTSDDYRRITKAEQIRSSSDYDDFYITSREEARQQVEDARYIIAKVKRYMESEKSAASHMVESGGYLK